MQRLVAIMIVLGSATSAWGWPSLGAPEPAQTPHPAVVRVIAAERDGASLGSGCLVAVDAYHGLVVTNWHVVRDATGPITVVFPNGFRSGAVVLRTDRNWDLAALAIQRPNVQPMTLSTEPPRPGDTLTIAGYGSGPYRAVSGRCTEYLSPGGNMPNEVVELDVPARFGDSGGPIFNARGEIAGVLFGANGTMFLGGYTMGSYCGRVRMFLAGVYGDFQRVPPSQAMIAEAPPPSLPAVSINAATPPLQVASPTTIAPPLAAAGPPASRMTPVAVAPVPALSAPAQPAQRPAVTAWQRPDTSAESSPGRTDQIKTILAAIGIIAILFHGIRLLGASVG